MISAAEKFVEDQELLHPLNPIWDNQFMTLLEQGRIQELDAVSNEELSPLPESRHMKSKPGSPLLPLFLHLATGVAKGVIHPDPGSKLFRIWLVKRQNRELNMQEKMMSYQPQTEAATSRFLNVRRSR